MYGFYLCPKYADDITYVTTSLEKLEEIEKDTRPKLKSYNIQVPYILGYKSHFFYLKIGSKIHCVLYVGNTKRETIFLLSKIKKIPVSIVFHRYPWFSIASVQSNSVRMLIIIICGFHSRQYKLT